MADSLGGCQGRNLQKGDLRVIVAGGGEGALVCAYHNEEGRGIHQEYMVGKYSS